VTGQANPNRSLAILFAFVFIDVLGFSLMLPLLPYYAREFGASTTVVGLLLGANALAQLLSAPILGRLSDRHGRKPMLILSLASTAVAFVVLGLAKSLLVLFLSRLLDGILGGSISLAQAYVTDVTDAKSRAKGLGLIGASFGLGFLFGPALGGWLSRGGDYSLPAFVAAGFSLLALLAVIVLLPESLSAERRQELRANPRTGFTLGALRSAMVRPCVGPLLWAQLIFSLAFAGFEATFALFADLRLGLDAQSTGYVLAYVGLLVVLVQGVGIRRLSDRLSDKQMVFGGSALLAATLLGWGISPSLPVLLVVLFPLSLGSGMLRVAVNSALTKSVYPEEVGGALGLSSSLGSLARVASPVVGGFLIGQVSTAAPGVVGAVLMAGLALYAYRRILFVPDLTCPAPEG